MISNDITATAVRFAALMFGAARSCRGLGRMARYWSVSQVLLIGVPDVRA